MADWAKEMDPKGKPATIIRLLNQTNEILEDATFMPGNLPTGHRVTVDTALPGTTKRQINQGVPATKGKSAQFDEGFSIFTSINEVDVALATLGGNLTQFRFNQARRHFEQMNQDQATSMIYGNPATDPADYLGLAPRYASPTGAGNSANVFDAAGSGADNSSIFLVMWGPGCVWMGFPEGSQVGIEHDDRGIEIVQQQSSAGTGVGEPLLRMRAYVDVIEWKAGLVVEDWRCVVRIGSIDISELSSLTAEQAPTVFSTIIHQMHEAIYRLPHRNGRPAFYMNRTVHAGFSKLAMEKSLNVLTIEKGLSQFGLPLAYTAFLGVPLRQVDAILNTETAI